MVFFSVLDERAHKIQAAHYQKNQIVADFRKNSKFGEIKKHSENKQVHFER